MIIKTLRLLCCAGLATLAFALLSPNGWAEATAEYTRINMGGGYSQTGTVVVSDSIQQTTGAATQTGGRFTVTSVKKTDSGSTAVAKWKNY